MIAGYDARQLADYRARSVGFVFQFFNLLPSLTAAENVEFARVLVDGTAARSTRMPWPCSTGSAWPSAPTTSPDSSPAASSSASPSPARWRTSPCCCCCDEPTGSLDVETGREVLKVLDVPDRETDAAIVLVTHNCGDRADGRPGAAPPRNGQIERDIRNRKPQGARRAVVVKRRPAHPQDPARSRARSWHSTLAPVGVLALGVTCSWRWWV